MKWNEENLERLKEINQKGKIQRYYAIKEWLDEVTLTEEEKKIVQKLLDTAIIKN